MGDFFEIGVRKPYKIRAEDSEKLCVDKGGIVCNTGVLGGVYRLNDFDPIKGIPNEVYLTGFHSNWPSQERMDAIFGFLTQHRLTPLFGAHFDFRDIREACIALDEGRINGKIVVTNDIL